MKRLREEKTVPSKPVVAFYAHKGGVGKTTSCLTTAVRAAQKGVRVMLLDCDPQQNATAFLSQWQQKQRFDYNADYRAMVAHYRLQMQHDPTPDELLAMQQYGLTHRNLYDLLRLDAHDGYPLEMAKLPRLGYQINDQLSVMAAHPMLCAYDNQLGFEVANRGWPPNHMARLGWIIDFLLRDYDLVLLDLSPSNSLFNQMALATCAYFVMPVTGDRFTMQSLDTLDLMLDLAKRNFANRLANGKPIRVPQLLCLLYSQYKPGECQLIMNSISYYVSGDDAKHCEEIGATLKSQEAGLGAYMDVELAAQQMVLLTRANELHQKLGHAYYTVFDELTMSANSLLALERMGQRQEYDLLWQRICVTLFPGRKEWLL